MGKSQKARTIALVIITGLAVSWVRQELQHHWHWFFSWESFVGSWFIHTIGVSIFSAVAGWLIASTHEFFTGSEWKGDVEELAFCVVMTVLAGAVAIALVANWPASDDYDDSSAFVMRAA
jgi:hypothetical protein